MSIKIKREIWQDSQQREQILSLAEKTQKDVIIINSSRKMKKYLVQVFINENVVEKEFSSKRKAKKFIKLQKSVDFALISRYNKKIDDFDWWQYLLVNNHLVKINCSK